MKRQFDRLFAEKQNLAQWLVPIAISLVVILYESVIVPILQSSWQIKGNFLFEIFFYGIIGPFVAFFTIKWYRNWLEEKQNIDRLLASYEKHIDALEFEKSQRVAQNLHREILPNLAYVANKIDHTRNQLSRSSTEDSNEHLKSTAILLRDVMEDLSNKIDLLRQGLPLVTLERTIDFFDHLKSRLADIERILPIKTHFSVLGKRFSFEYEIESSLTRIVGEALNNAALHSRTSQLWLTLDYSDDEQIVVSIVDEGHGFPSTISPNEGPSFGLTTMREEAHRWNGSLLIKPVVGKGTTVTAIIPIERQYNSNESN